MNSNKSHVNWRQAASEAFLIFLGVGLALVGQAWWEYRDDRRVEGHLLIGLQEDLRRDSDDVGRVIVSARARAVGANRLLEFVDDPAAWGSPSSPWPENVEALVGANITTNISPWQALRMASRLQTLDMATASYTEAMTTGQFDVIRDTKLRSQIADYYSMGSTLIRTDTARDEVQLHRLSAALASIGISPEGQGPEQSLLTELGRGSTVIAELINARRLAVEQIRFMTIFKGQLEALLVNLESAPET